MSEAETVALLVTVAFCGGCSEAHPVAPGGARDVPFETALAAGITKRWIDVGDTVRPAFTIELDGFASDPFPLDGHTVLWGAAGLKTAAAAEPLPVTFYIEVKGPKGETSMSRELGTKEHPENRWHPFRLDLPEEIGSPVTLRARIDPPPQQQPSDQSVVLAVPRLLLPGESDLPNVLFVVFDTLRADHTSAYGYARDTTPFLSHLAERGVRLEEAVAPFPSTLTSHWTIFSGLDPVIHGMYPGKTRELNERATNAILMAEAFHQAGYLTAAFTEGGYVHSDWGFARGFDLYHNGRRGKAAATFRAAGQWLEENADRPHFMFLHTYAVHIPYRPRAKFREMFAPDYEGRWKTSYGWPAQRDINNDVEMADAVTPVEIAQIMALYDAEIRELDAEFERFWLPLAWGGALDDTLVVITSDHGEDFLEHGWIGHGTTLYDPALRVPLLFLWGDALPRGAVLRCQRPLVDLLPTVLELAGLGSPGDVDGQSFASEVKAGVCRGDRAASRGDLLAQFAWSASSIIH